MFSRFRSFRSGGIGVFIVMLVVLAACGPGNEIIDPEPPTSPPIATVKADIGCRSGPSSDYAVLDTLKTGEILQIQGRSQKGDAWVVFNPDLGETCWVGGEWVDVAGNLSLAEIINPDPPNKPSATVKAEAPCRSGPSTEYDLLASLTPGVILDVQGRSPDGNAWVVFSTDLGGTCWVDAVWVDVAGALSLVGIINPSPPDKPSATVMAEAPCRSGPSAEYDSLASLTPGVILDVQGRSPDGNAWVVFSTDLGGTCWVDAAWVDVAGALSLVGIIDPDPPFKPSATATVKQDSVCRDGPTTEYRILAYFNAGDVLNIFGQNRQGTSWVVANPSTGGQCWIAGNLVDVSGDTDLVSLIDPDPPTIILPTATTEDNPSPFNCAQYNTNPVSCDAEPACKWDPSVLPNGECKNN